MHMRTIGVMVMVHGDDKVPPREYTNHTHVSARVRAAPPSPTHTRRGMRAGTHTQVLHYTDAQSHAHRHVSDIQSELPMPHIQPMPHMVKP